MLKANWVGEAFGMRVKHEGEQSAIMSSARTTLEGEWTGNVKNVLRACIATSIALGTLGKILRKAPRQTGALKDLKIRILRPGDKDCYHDWWLVPTITEEK